MTQRPSDALGSDEALFGKESARYVRYRPGLPDAAVRILYVIDFERSAPVSAARDEVGLPNAWAGRPNLYEAFLAGYGRPLTDVEQQRLVVDSVLDSTSGTANGTAHGDPELVERGLRTLATLRTEHGTPSSPLGGTV